MKTITLIMALGCSITAQAQYTIGAGATLSEISEYDADAIDRVGYYITAEATHKVSQYFALSASVQWITQRVDPIRVNSIGVGMYAKAIPFSGASIIAGLQHALLTGVTYDGERLRSGFNDGTISLALGAGYLVNDRIEIKAMYVKQITDDAIFDSSLQFGLNYKIQD